MTSDARTLVEKYYRLVDDQDLDAMLNLFADDAVYERPGYEALTGRAAIERFYRGQRVIASGAHTLHSIIAEGARIAVDGRFRGTLRDGSSAEVRFADFFTLSDGKFVHRTTYFFAPSV